MHKSMESSCVFFLIVACLLYQPVLVHTALQYLNISNPRALCNDFTRAGFFLFQQQQNLDTAGKWVIFLESGGFCFSAESCNERFFHPDVRRREKELQNRESGKESIKQLQDFDPAAAWERNKHRNLSEVVSPLMTSMYRFRNSRSAFSGGTLTIEGRDILDARCERNPTFCDHNKVVIPYCSSDLWLGNDTRTFAAADAEEVGMDNDFYSKRYKPDSTSLQFTFQGSHIFRGAMEDLLKFQDATMEEVILAGSSAGGVGVFNHAKWFKARLHEKFPQAKVKVLLDSSWFINFNDDIQREFNNSNVTFADDDPKPSNSSEKRDEENLFSIISWHPACQETHVSAPCCISAHCVMARQDYFPSDTPVFVIVSLYDIFLLGASLRGLVTLAYEEESLKPGYALDFLRTVSEYGGAMNQTIAELETEVDFVSFYITGCFQHIYLATSTLWGLPGESLFGKSLVEFTRDVGVIRHSIESDVWSRFMHNRTSHDPQSPDLTIQQAITKWYSLPSQTTLRDSCQGPYCNEACPEMFVLGELTSNSWLPSSKVALVLIVVGVALACILLKLVFVVWLWRLEWKQHLYLWSLGNESYTADIERTLQFPDCLEENAVSVACLNLCYAVKIRAQMKDERKDNVTPLVLGDVPEEDELELDLEEEEEEVGGAGPDETEERKGEEGEGSSNDYLPRRYERFKRAKTRKTLRDTYKSYHEGSPSDRAKPVQKLRNIAERTFRHGSRRGSKRGSRRVSRPFLTRGSSAFMDNANVYGSSVGPSSLATNFSKSCTPSFTFSPPDNPFISTPGPLTGTPGFEANPFMTNPVLVDDNYIPASSHEAEEVEELSPRSPGSVEGVERRERERPEKENMTGEKEVQGVTKEMEANITTPDKGQKLSLTGTGFMLAKQRTSFSIRHGNKEVKEILKGISLYFNPGELIGIMGPSGCGKTTFLDLLTGRRHTGAIQGHIYVNGVRMEEVRDWYISNTGYVLQLATPYYEELTVRENLTLAAQIKLSNNFSLREKFQRVEQVMFVSGLLELAETKVGGTTGPGLSGGQKRRLAVALQLLKLPSVIFLDEPTSGLDAASSFELLSHLNQLADSNRTVILTIHQPRLEIFHMFHRLVLLCDGKVAYHGAPERAYEVFVNALKARYLEQGLIIPELEDHNPADVIMDILGNSKMRQIITDFYQSSEEPRFVQNAINMATVNDQKTNTLMAPSGGSTMKSLTMQFSYALYGARKVHNKHAGLFYRLAALEARASKRLKWSQTFYLPFIFFAYGLLLGTAYFQQNSPLLVMSGFCVYSVASALFMFPILFHYYSRALEVFSYEHGDGVGNALDLIIQGYVHAISTAAIPVVVCAGVLYVLLVNAASYDFNVFGQVVIVNLVLNQCWTALLIALICAFPKRAFRLSPVISSVAGFASGFFIPIQEMHWGYRWLFYINPNYYGFSASAFLLLENLSTGCQGSEFECYTTSGMYTLNQFSFNDINPYLHVLILMIFTAFYLFLAIFANWFRFSLITAKLVRVRNVIRRSSLYTTNSDEDQGSITDQEIQLVEDDMKKDIGESLHGEVDTPPDPVAQEKVLSAEVTREVDDENGQLVISNTADLREEAEETSQAGSLDLQSSGSIMKSLTPSEEHNTLGIMFERKPSNESNKPQTPSTPSTLDLASRSPRRLSKSLSSDDIIAASPFEQPSSLGQSGGKKVAFLAPEEDDMLIRSMDSGRSVSGTFKVMQDTTPKLQQQQSAYLQHGETHRVWKPSSPGSPAPSRQMPLLVKQKSKAQMAIRKKSLENRLLATRELLKLQNEHIIGAGGGGGVVGGDSGSPLIKTKPISFTQAMKMVSAQISTTKKRSNGSFHNIVDQYVAQKKAEENQWGMASSSVTTPRGGAGGVSGASSPLLTSSHLLGSTAMGRSRKHGFCLQAPRHARIGGQAVAMSPISPPAPTTPTQYAATPPMSPKVPKAFPIPIGMYRKTSAGTPPASPAVPDKKGRPTMKHPLEKSRTEVAMALSPLSLQDDSRTQSESHVAMGTSLK